MPTLNPTLVAFALRDRPSKKERTMADTLYIVLKVCAAILLALVAIDFLAH